MNCRRCQTDNPDESRYCSRCGALLTKAPAKPRLVIPWHASAAAGALVVLIALYLFVPGIRSHRRPAASGAPAAADASAPGPAASGGSEAVPPSPLALVAGRFSLPAAADDTPAFVETVLVDGSWAALPLWTFLGPGAPRLESPGPSGTLPALVSWTAPDPLVLCRLDLGESPDTAELAAYDVAAVLEWRPLSGERASLAIEPGPLRSAGSFKAFALFKPIEGPGVLVQQGKIVGWTYGGGVASGYLWAPADGAAPQASLPASDLATAIRPGSREGAFLQALSAAAGVADDFRLEAFAAGFRGRSLFQPEDLPEFLKPAAIAARMSSLTSALVERGRAAEAARILDANVLAAASDIPLIKAAAAAHNDAGGFEAAHRLLADLRRGPALQTAAGSSAIDAVEVDLAKSAIHKILNERGFGALDIFEQAGRPAPGDIEFQLLGVEAAVLEKQWVRAEELLRGGGTYPDALADKARTLERLVEEGRREEDSVTIRFTPGDDLIPVYAYLNKKYRQKFFIDTGATSTIIPLAAAAALEIRINDSTPVVGIQGIAGGDLAFQVDLDSIEIEGLTVKGLEVLVYDLGEEENAGLLGNDFLRNFQVDLDNVKGILKLRKK